MPTPLFSPQQLEDFFAELQDTATKQVWSQGVEQSRRAQFVLEKASDACLSIKVLFEGKTVNPRVHLWLEDLDWKCDCRDKEDPCSHVVAAILALKNNRVQSGLQAQSSVAHLVYEFFPQNNALAFQRWIQRGSQKEALNQSLVTYVADVKAGRHKGLVFSPTKRDFAVDLALGVVRHGILPWAILNQVFKALENEDGLLFAGSPTRIVSRPIKRVVEVIQKDQQYWIRFKKLGNQFQVFSNAAVKTTDGLGLIEPVVLSSYEQVLLSEDSPPLSGRTLIEFVSVHLADLVKKFEVQHQELLPKIQDEPLSVILTQVQGPSGHLEILPRLIYGHPEIAEVSAEGLLLKNPKYIPRRNLSEEKKWLQKLKLELNLQPGQWAQFAGLEALRFIEKAKNWQTQGEVTGFQVNGMVMPKLQWNDGELKVSCVLRNQAGEDVATSVDFARLQQAFASGQGLISLGNLGFAKLPQDWFARYGASIGKLLSEQKQKPLQKFRYFFTAQLIDESNQYLSVQNEISQRPQKFEEALTEFCRQQHWPQNLDSVLRHYQKEGVNWLALLFQMNLGALLADDMGLGKTLQVLGALRGRTLIVAPTSVLSSWQSQAQKFRPDLKVCLYHGSRRDLNIEADVVLTSYALLRLDNPDLLEIPWQCVVLDEAQTIKNSQSQVAQAAFRLRAPQRVALSGTPIENHLRDLWSIFNFLNPGLLGSQADFLSQYANSEHNSDGQVLQNLKTLLKPFVLRRMKSEVARDLPLKTEVVLRCALTDQERAVYESILAATREEVMAKLGETTNAISLLEALLRLRQACCHLALLPGHKDVMSSSKLELLLTTLEQSIENDHKSLVFSQWTSLLDLVEPLLQQRGIRYLRLDGSSTNRAQIMEEFQQDSGIKVLLMSLKAGGVGLTLTAADHVYLLDPWWNPAAEKQAADRAHRIGQDRPVFVHKLVAEATVEEQILELQHSKLELAEGLLENNEQEFNFKIEDLRALLT